MRTKTPTDDGDLQNKSSKIKCSLELEKGLQIRQKGQKKVQMNLVYSCILNDDWREREREEIEREHVNKDAH